MSTKTTTFLDNLSTWSREAARAQLDARVPLTETIGKIARHQQLGAEQVKRLCEAANHEVYAELFRAGDEGLFTFPVADYTAVLGQLLDDDAEPKQAQNAEDGADTTLLSEDYLHPPTGLFEDGGEVLDHVFGHMFPKTSEVWPGFQEREQHDRVRLLLNRKTETLAELQSRQICGKLALDTAQEQIYRHVRQAILSGQSLEDIYQAIHNLYPATDLDSAAGVFREVLERLKAENLVDPRAEKEVFTPHPRLVNRESPVAQAVTTHQKEARQQRVVSRAIEAVHHEIGDLRALLRTCRKEVNR